MQRRNFLKGAASVVILANLENARAQNAPGTLSGQQNADILSFILSAAKFPTGTTELPKEAGILKTIKFETKKGAALQH